MLKTHVHVLQILQIMKQQSRYGSSGPWQQESVERNKDSPVLQADVGLREI